MNISRDIIETVTVAGIYDLRPLQIKRCGRLGPRAVLALDYCPNILLFVQGTENVYTFTAVYGDKSFQIRISGVYLPNST